MNNIGLVHAHRGEHRQAIAMYKRVVAIHDAALGELHFGNIMVLTTRAGSTGCTTPINTQHRVLVCMWVCVVQALANMAHAHIQMGETAEALPLLRRALDVARESVGEASTQFAQMRAEEGMCLMAEGQVGGRG